MNKLIQRLSGFLRGDKTPSPAGSHYKIGVWNDVRFSVRGREVLCLYMPAENPVAVLGLGLGFNALPYDSDMQDIYKTLVKNGISVITTAFKRTMPEDQNFLPRFQEDTDAFFFDTDSPLFTVPPAELPRSILAHSARGLTTLRSLLHNKTVKFANTHFKSVYIMNPMLGIAGVTTRPTIRITYSLFSRFRPHHLPGTTIVERLYMSFNNLSINPNHPTHAQIQTMAKAAEDYRQIVARTGGADIRPQFNFKFIIGTDDTATCPIINQKTVETVGAEPLLFMGAHNPLANDPDSLPLIVNELKAQALAEKHAMTSERMSQDNLADTSKGTIPA